MLAEAVWLTHHMSEACHVTWSACVCGPDPSHRVGVLCMGVVLHSDTAKQRFALGRLNSHFRNSKMWSRYSHDHVLTAAKLLSTASSHLALRLGLKRKCFFFVFVFFCCCLFVCFFFLSFSFLFVVVPSRPRPRRRTSGGFNNGVVPKPVPRRGTHVPTAA